MDGTGNRASDPAEVTPTPGVVAELMLAGVDLGDLLERLVRRHADLSLAQFNAMRVVKGREPAAAQASDLTRVLRMSSAHATTVLQHLEGRGFIEREESVTDRRRRPVTLTEEGRAALSVATPALAQLEARVAEVLGGEQMSALWGGLRSVRLSVREALATDDLDCVGP